MKLCGCSHPVDWHELVDGKHAGRCKHGCGCDGVHARRRRSAAGVAAAKAAKAALAPDPLGRVRRAFNELRDALLEVLAPLGAPTITMSHEPRFEIDAAMARTIDDMINRTPAREASDPVPRRPARETPTGLGAGEMRVFKAIAQHRGGVTRSQLTVLTGYKRSTRDRYLQLHMAAGRVAEIGGRLHAEPRFVEQLLGEFTPLPTGDALRAYWLEQLPEGERVILGALAGAYPEGLTRDQLSEITDYKRSTRDRYLQLLARRELVEEHPEQRHQLRASAMLFGKGG